MKKKIIFALCALVSVAATAEVYNYLTIKQNNKTISIPIEQVESVSFTTNDQTTTTPEPNYTLRVLTFEDKDYKGDGNYLGKKDWTSLVDSKQYGGPLLYNDFESTPYRWYDQNNTELYAAICPNEDDEFVYWSGGEAISNYVDTTYSTAVVTYQQQLATPYGGHNGSKNFCVHNGYFDGIGYNKPSGGIWFKDGKARVIDHMYVCLTSYALSAGMVGDTYSPKATDTDWVKFVAIGTDAEGKTHEISMTVCENGKFKTDWEKWDLSVLGEIVRLDFNITSSMMGNWGMTFPGYIAYDDIAVRFPNE